jgi:hypothetical protein
MTLSGSLHPVWEGRESGNQQPLETGSRLSGMMEVRIAACVLLWHASSRTGFQRKSENVRLMALTHALPAMCVGAPPPLRGAAAGVESGAVGDREGAAGGSRDMRRCEVGWKPNNDLTTSVWWWDGQGAVILVRTVAAMEGDADLCTVDRADNRSLKQDHCAPVTHRA